MSEEGVLLIGVGNRLRGDDAFGPLAIDRLLESSTIPSNWIFVDGGEVPENALGLVEKEKPDRILLIDACDWGGMPGEIRFFSADEILSLPIRTISTHGVPLSFWVKMTQVEHPSVLIELLGVQAASLEFNASLTPPVQAALEHIEDIIKKHLS
ncbi:hydrogenase maturation protease [bacterium]|nr:hydrogenase maturation protease [bacterium]